MTADVSTTILDPVRVEALRRTGLLDSPPEQAFDRLTRLATMTLRVPTAMVTLIDEDRQYFKSCQGMPAALASSSETPLSYSFCKHTIALREPLIINDTRLAPLVADNPAICEYPALAYAGIPLITADGHAIGSFCVVDDTPRTWTDSEIAVLGDLAALAITEIELRSAAAAADRERTEKVALLDSAGEGIYGIDLQGRCTFLNSAGAAMLGVTAAEVLGRNMHELIHHSHADGTPYAEAQCPLYQAFRTGRRVRLDNECLWRRDGSSFPAEYSSSPIMVDGEISGAVVTFSDITERKRAEVEKQHLLAQLQAERTRLDAIVDSVPGVIWEAWGQPDDRSQQINYISKHVEPMLGYSVDEWLAAPNFWLTIVHPADQERAAQEAAAIFASGQPGTSRFRWIARDGRMLWVEAHSTAVRDAAGAPLGMRGVTMDISERVRAEEAVRVAYRAMAATSTGITISDPSQADNPIVYHNPAFEAITGYGGAEVIGRNCRFLQGADTDQSALDVIRQALAEQRECHVVLKNYRKDGRPFWNELAISPVVDAHGEVTHYVGVQTDITERKQAEEQLSEAKEAAEIANRAKSQFLANMSHELRTPLNAVILYSELLQEEAADRGVEAFIPDLEKIRTAGKRLLALVNDVLDLAKIEAGKMDLFLESFDVAPLLADVADTVQPLVRKKGNTLVLHCAPDVGSMHADLAKVRQALLNLVSNAAKFTGRGTITLAAARYTVEDRGWIVFTVTDTGIGMTAAQMEHLFQPFSQADASTTRKFGGTGLGLALTRRFCRIMDGDVAVESVPGCGSTFTVQLPADVGASMEREGDASTFASGGTSDARPVLVIDDDPVVRDLLARTLRQEGYPVAVAVDGEEGLRLARQLRPIAITLDVLMPRMDGWAVLEALKAEPVVSRIPVIMLTLADDKDLGCMVGASEYLTKPVDQQRLLALLDMYRPSHLSGSILIVDDDAMTCSVLRRMLESAGCAVSEAANGREALERLAQSQPDLILLDLVMPVMDGFELAREVRRQESLRSIPIIVMTAKDLTGDDRLRLTGNVEKILQKGMYSRTELLREVRDLVASYARAAGSPARAMGTQTDG